jgi:hypothetical protein
MNPEELISALGALEERAQIAKREIEYISSFDRLQKRVWKLEQEIEELKNR